MACSRNGSYVEVAKEIGELVTRKNKSYGDAHNKSAEFLRILFPDGVPVEQYNDMLTLVRIFDKQMRIATDKDALGESPFQDIAGYAILKCADQKDDIEEIVMRAEGSI